MRRSTIAILIFMHSPNDLSFYKKEMSAKTKWLLYSVSGLLFFGFGLCLLGEAILMKFTNSPYWVAAGTVALVITNTGLCLFGQAIIVKVKEVTD